MSVATKKEIQLWDWLFGKTDQFPLYQDSLTIPFPLNHKSAEDDELDEILGRGKGDPDIYGYPGQEEQQNVVS